VPELPAELLILAPLALAAGIDLYLTLLLLAAAPTTPWWDHPLPGALGDLDSPGVLLMVGTFYLLEFTAERVAPAGLLWNAFHAAIRPIAGALLALLLLDGAALSVVVAGAVAAGALASVAHAVRSGGSVVRWLGSITSPHVLLVSLLEDAIVIGLVALALDAPLWALGVAAGLALVALITSPSHARAFAFAVRLAPARAFKTFTRRRWMGPEEIPLWVRRTFEEDVRTPGGELRGSPAGAHRVPGAPRFTTGWIVIRGGSPRFVFPTSIVPGRAGGGATSVELDTLVGEGVVERGFFHRVDLRTDGGAPASLFFGLDGPSVESLKTEFMPA
jgi:hypothetical protein